jgi:hypothetical protein
MKTNYRCEKCKDKFWSNSEGILTCSICKTLLAPPNEAVRFSIILVSILPLLLVLISVHLYFGLTNIASKLLVLFFFVFSIYLTVLKPQKTRAI